MAEVQVPVEAVVRDRLVQVVEDLVGVGDRVVLGPRLELEAEALHVGIGPNTRVAEQIPGPADRVAAVDDGEGPARLLRLEVMTQVDPGDPGSDDQHVDVLESPCHLSGCAHVSSLRFMGCS